MNEKIRSMMEVSLTGSKAFQDTIASISTLSKVVEDKIASISTLSRVVDNKLQAISGVSMRIEAALLPKKDPFAGLIEEIRRKVEASFPRIDNEWQQRKLLDESTADSEEVDEQEEPSANLVLEPPTSSLILPSESVMARDGEVLRIKKTIRIGRKRLVFISYASQDRDVARVIFQMFDRNGISVWFDEKILKEGDDLQNEITQGIINCRLGVLLLSPSYFLPEKKYIKYELRSLKERWLEEEIDLIPIWHQLNKKFLLSKDPALASLLAYSTKETPIERVASQLVLRAGLDT